MGGGVLLLLDHAGLLLAEVEALGRLLDLERRARLQLLARPLLLHRLPRPQLALVRLRLRRLRPQPLLPALEERLGLGLAAEGELLTLLLVLALELPEAGGLAVPLDLLEGELAVLGLDVVSLAQVVVEEGEAVLEQQLDLGQRAVGLHAAHKMSSIINLGIVKLRTYASVSRKFVLQARPGP